MGPTRSRPLGRRLVAGGVAALIGVGLALVFAPPAKADPNVDEAQFFADLNVVRARNGRAPLATDGQLINVARAWSAQMAAAGGLSHNPNLGSQISNWRTLGENVGTGGDEAAVEAALEASPHHFANMVDPSYVYVGIGVVESGGNLWVTEDFKQPKTGTLPSTAVPAPAPTPHPTPRPPSAPGPAAAPVHSSAPATQAAAAHSQAAVPAASAGAGAPSAEATLASATPAPSSSPPSASGPAKSHARILPSGLAIVSAGPLVDGMRLASLFLFAVLGAVALLAAHGRLPGVPRFSEAGRS